MTDSTHPSQPNTPRKPEWAPADADDAFASRVVQGRESRHDGLPYADPPPPQTPARRRRQLSVADYVRGVLAGDRMTLGRAITLIESNAAAHQETAQEVLRQLLPHTGQSIRVGITGVPGAGKSTFIEAFGMHLLAQGHKVAVLAIDPTSSVTRGSILGDKTRMEQLSREENAFIRPSPTGGVLGGVARKTRETMLVVEAAGFDVVLLETVGVGQSETMVRSMVDFFLLLQLAGAGDELQGIKKGIMELADAILINKADGDNLIKARSARADYNMALHYLAPATEGWRTKAYICSALTGMGIADIWQVIEAFRAQTGESGVFARRRQAQAVDWMKAMIEEHLRQRFFNHPAIKARLPQVEAAVTHDQLPVTTAVQELLTLFEETGSRSQESD
ncbi:MAG: GTPase ArgK [Anaerolineae bacterium]|nr:GTPase ArgK [Anaerolineae bacterium]